MSNKFRCITPSLGCREEDCSTCRPDPVTEPKLLNINEINYGYNHETTECCNSSYNRRGPVEQRVVLMPGSIAEQNECKRAPSELHIGDVTTVNFALGPAKVRIIGYYTVANGDTIYHVEDTLTGHQDYVGGKWISEVEK